MTFVGQDLENRATTKNSQEYPQVSGERVKLYTGETSALVFLISSWIFLPRSTILTPRTG